MNASDTEYTTHVKIMNLRGELPHDLYTGLPNPKFQKKQAVQAIGRRVYVPGYQWTSKAVWTYLALFLGAGWLVIHVLSGGDGAKRYASFRKQSAAELEAECDRTATFKRAQGDLAAREYWQACVKAGPKTVMEWFFR